MSIEVEASGRESRGPAKVRGSRLAVRAGRCLARLLALGLAGALITGCERNQWDPTIKVGDPEGHLIDAEGRRTADGADTRPGAAQGIALAGDRTGLPTPKEAQKRGTGTFVQKVEAPTVDTTPGDVTLNFDGTDIRDVVKVILGDLLNVNYVLDPTVQGVASLQTGRPLRREHLLATLETLLRANSAALVNRGGTYEVVPITSAVQGKLIPQLGDTDRALPEGYSLRVVPLQYIGADEMSRILTPLVPEGSIVRVDNLRNLLLIAGTSPEMGNIMDTIRVFDVDWMAGLSVGFYTLEFAKATDVVTQLESLLADEGGNPFKGLFRFVAVESANALLVVSPQQKYLKQAEDWIERLDLAEATGDAAERLFVYRVKHGSAETLADILTQLFEGEGGGGQQKPVGRVAPGLRQATAESSRRGQTSRNRMGDRTTTQATTADTAARSAVSSTIELSSQVSIVADVVNNSLLVRSSPRDYKKILDALKQLDLVPLQVLVEATIVEVSLSGNLQYGVQWLFKGKSPGGERLRYSLNNDGTEILEQTFPGFNWAVINRLGDIRATLSALAGDGLLNVLSSPSVMVLDNQTANIQVGQEVPTVTSRSVATSETDLNTQNIEYRETGVLLSVKPRVTPGGLVQMEIEQEVSQVDKTAQQEGIDSPTFSTRKINSSVAVRSNQALVLGGLIQDQRSEGKSGIPGLYGLPLVGPLFGQTSKDATRTELVVVITPKVIASDQDVEKVTDDFRTKLKGLQSRF